MQLEAHEAADYGEGGAQSDEVPPVDQKWEIPKLDTSVALWLILFVFGGGLLALYYAGIGYFPEVSWQDALTFMALMTIIGGSLLVAYSFLLFVPGAIWSEFLIFDKQLHKVLMMSARHWEPCVWSVTKQILFPFAIFMAFCHFLLYEDGPAGFVPLGAAASLIAVSALLARDLREGLEIVAKRKAVGQSSSVGAIPDTSKLKGHRLSIGISHAPLFLAFIAKAAYDYRPVPGLLWVFALLPLASFAVLFVDRWIENRRLRQASESAAKLSTPDKLSLLCRSVLAFGSAALLSLMALWFFHRVYKGGASGARVNVPWQLLVLCTLVVIVTNLAVSILFHKHRRQALFTSFLAALLLLGAGEIIGSDAEATLPAKIMEKFGFGGQRATLVLTERGGRLLCQQAIPVQFEEWELSKNGVADSGVKVDETGSKKTAEGKQGEKGLLARTVGMTILSRLGSEYLLRYEGQKRTIALPKGEVVSWSTDPKEQELRIQDGCKLHRVSGLQQDGSLSGEQRSN